jgi:hypothetical protein
MGTGGTEWIYSISLRRPTSINRCDLIVLSHFTANSHIVVKKINNSLIGPDQVGHKGNNAANFGYLAQILANSPSLAKKTARRP